MMDFFETRAGYPQHMDIAPDDLSAHSDKTSASKVASAMEFAAQSLLAGHGIQAVTLELSCRLHRTLPEGEVLCAGLRIAELGTASVRYEIGLFRPGEDKPAAQGMLVQVFLENGKPVQLQEELRRQLSRLKSR